MRGLTATLPLGVLALAGCHATTADVGNGNAAGGDTPCVKVVGGADCDTNGTGTGTGTGTGGTGTGTGATGGGTEGIETWVGIEDPGTGAGQALWEIQAEVAAVRVEDDGGTFHYESSFDVWVWDANGFPASGLDVALETATLGDTPLPEDNNQNGRYRADAWGYARTYTLTINPSDPSTAFSATSVGPEPHTFVLPPQPWDVTLPVTVQWSPFGAMYANIDTRGGNNVDIPDTGLYEIPAFTLDSEAGEVGEERVTLVRWDVLDLDALPTSTFTISVEIENDDIDTTDSRVGSVQGDITLDGDFAGMTGDVYVLAWPDALDPQNDPYLAWTKIPDGDFTDFGQYLIDTLEPGDWYLLCYLDADGSDVGPPAPGGPTWGDPWDDADVQIDPSGTSFRNFDLAQTWQGW